MHSKFQKIYGELIESYRDAMIAAETDAEQRRSATSKLALISETVDDEVSRLNMPCRQDARLFLIVNLHQIIVQPLSHPDSPTGLSDEIIKDLKEDVRNILQSAQAESENREREEIAASQVLWGLAKVLDNLKLKSWRLWEKVE